MLPSNAHRGCRLILGFARICPATYVFANAVAAARATTTTITTTRDRCRWLYDYCCCYCADDGDDEEKKESRRRPRSQSMRGFRAQQVGGKVLPGSLFTKAAQMQVDPPNCFKLLLGKALKMLSLRERLLVRIWNGCRRQHASLRNLSYL